ncbi:hypothetical protein [Microbacterium sp. VKM Ac-2923]|uniref:hypothetical protein n=1 Tax=Microbacterium sp. VKM Ac-2923 TaxID=2929476 RepID=UPI001FB2BA74|nr:hypothetical protein [Microbacterium sp. VKM Ac-2923]MCJ1707856.1 hypothetical protein [Microbacterium sp. VKM Ac-2923]
MADLSEVDDLVTDSTADPTALRQIRDAGVSIHVVNVHAKQPSDHREVERLRTKPDMVRR